jgi:hypothetical protein
MPVKLNSSGGGSVTLTTPSTATDYTATFPANTGNVVTTGSSGVVTQAMLGTGVTGNGPAFSAYASVGQTLTSGVFTKVQLNTKEFDTASCFDNTTNYRFTPNVAGYYMFSWCCGGKGATTMTGSSSYLYKNNAGIKYGAQLQLTFAVNAFQMNSGSALVYMNGTTDQVELWVYITGSGTITTITGSDAAFLSGALVRAA